MATRRKYKPKAYRDGGAVIADTELPITVAPIEEAAESEIPPPSNQAADAVMAALQATARAEQMARGGQPAPSVPAPQMSARRVAFIQQHPELLDPANREAVESYWKQSQRMGMQDEVEVDNFVLQGLRWEQRAREPRYEGADVPPEPAPSPAAPPQPRREAFQAPRSEPRRPSMPLTAPVSRSEGPTMSGRPRQPSMHLTEEERQVARDSIPDRPDAPRLTNAQKEYQYALNKAKYAAMKADGSYSEQRER